MAHTNFKRITITVPEGLLVEAEQLKQDKRSRILQDALRVYVRHLRRERLRREAEKLDQDEEIELAESALVAGNEVWDKY
ncbi:MAG: hypothetical protein KGZ35_07770 [Truepera sp.]|nr:hypothetical protein [Truepera sp.]